MQNYSIEISGLKKAFGDTVALSGLDIHIASGQMYGLIGPDGAGKTTALRILCGLIDADEGSALIGGFDSCKETSQVREIIGYMPQRFSLYPDLTVDENMQFFAELFGVKKSEWENRRKQLLQFSKLAPFKNRRAAALSGGMKQKLALSCTLIHTPKILMLDEPTTGVDPVSRREFWNILKSLKKEGVTILVTTSYMDEAELCDQIGLIHKGKILAQTEPNKIEKLLNLKFIEIQTSDLRQTARTLKDQSEFHNIQTFGDKIHVSGHDIEKMKKTIINKLGNAGISITAIKVVNATLEDVFVELMQEK